MMNGWDSSIGGRKSSSDPSMPPRSQFPLAKELGEYDDDVGGRNNCTPALRDSSRLRHDLESALCGSMEEQAVQQRLPLPGAMQPHWPGAQQYLQQQQQQQDQGQEWRAAFIAALQLEG